MVAGSKGEPMEIKVEHPNGYLGILYGEHSMSVYDSSGNKVLHTGRRTIHTKEDLYNLLEKIEEFTKEVMGN